MLTGFPPIFVADTKIIYDYNFVPTLNELIHKVRFFKTMCGIFHFQFRFAFTKAHILVQQNPALLAEL